MVKLGSTVRDTVTGFTGKVTARCEYLHGPARVHVETLNVVGDHHEAWLEEGRLETPGEHDSGPEGAPAA